MQVKGADDKQPDLNSLATLLSRSDLSPTVRQRIELEIRTLRAGVKGEHDAAYQIEFYYRDSPNVTTLHDLRIVYHDRVAQIDHLLINRLFEVWVCESKSFAEGVAINERGEWSAYYRGRPRGIPSPIEQNRRHVEVLRELLGSGSVDLPRRLGFTLKPELRSLVLLSANAQISRPQGRAGARVDGLDTVVKCDQLLATITRAVEAKFDNMLATKDFTPIMKFVGKETIQNLAHQLAALHSPVVIDWPARFGLSPTTTPAPSDLDTHAQPATPRAEAKTEPSPNSCAACGKVVTAKIANFCLENPARFRGRTYCWDCQRKSP